MRSTPTTADETGKGGEGAQLLEKRLPQDSKTWQALHAGAFLLGGVLFILGSAVLLLPYSDALATLSAVLYTIGSLGFLSVDVQELLTFTGCPLLLNIALSVTGSALYVIGSYAFLPKVYGAHPTLGVAGFVYGSACIAISQTFKLVRIARAAPAASGVLNDVDSFSACGVEGGACVGASFFFGGTLALWVQAPEVGSLEYTLILVSWVLGSLAFTTGGLFLAHRHFKLGLA